MVGAKSSKITIAKNIVYTLATSQSARSSREVAKVLGVDKKNIKRVAKKKAIVGFTYNYMLDISPTCYKVKHPLKFDKKLD